MLFYCMDRSIHKIQKLIEKEKRHKDWLEQNMRHSKQLKNSRKTMLLLYTELAEAYQQKQVNLELQTSQLEGE